MIEVIFRNNKFLVKGTYFLGIAGTYVNEDFGGNMLEVSNSLEEILNDLDDKEHFFFKPLIPFFPEGKRDGDSIAKGLETYYNLMENEIKKNIKQINDNILYNLFEDLESCRYPFWEIEEAVIPGTLEGYDMNNLLEQIYAGENTFKWVDDFYNTPNNGTVKKVDLEGKLRKKYPMFNFDGLYQSIKPEGISFDGRFMSFQFSDGWGGELLEAAYDELDENFASTDWHNH